MKYVSSQSPPLPCPIQNYFLHIVQHALVRLFSSLIQLYVSFFLSLKQPSLGLPWSSSVKTPQGRFHHSGPGSTPSQEQGSILPQFYRDLVTWNSIIIGFQTSIIQRWETGKKWRTKIIHKHAFGTLSFFSARLFI